MLIFTKWGGVTLGIYAIHPEQIIATALRRGSILPALRLPCWLYVCCLWVMVSAISYLCYRLIERNRYLSLLFLRQVTTYNFYHEILRSAFLVL
ncbi:MAG: hypothetical protein ACLUVG_09790 [Phocaeicola vulgatus]